MKNPWRFWNSEVAEVPLDLQRERKRERARKCEVAIEIELQFWDRESRFWDEASCDSRSICEETASRFCDEAICEEAILRSICKKKRHDSSHLWGRSDYEIKRFVWKWFWDAICVEVIMRLSDLCGIDFDFVWNWFLWGSVLNWNRKKKVIENEMKILIL
jgi:hypothetical protein